MPSYEMALLLRKMSKPEIKESLRRVAKVIFNEGGFIRKMENLGLKATPYKIHAHGANHKEANYFIINFDVNPRKLTDINDEYKRDIDILSRTMVKVLSPGDISEIEPPCTLEDDLKPPVYRKSVQEVLERAKYLDKPKYKYNSGLDYYPFQK